MSRLVIFIYLLQIGLAMSFDYCQEHLCPSGARHIACENSGYISNKCRRNADIEVIDKNLRKLLLRKHNEFRNNVAANGWGDFGIAASMRTLVWNKELAYLAELNVKQCTQEQSECVATTLYANPGRNSALTKYSDKRTLEDVVTQQINEWVMKNETEHNKQIILDEADQFGCAILREEYTCTTYQYLTCIYSKSVENCSLLYLQGNTPGESCVSGPNECYPNLCSPKEK